MSIFYLDQNALDLAANCTRPEISIQTKENEPPPIIGLSGNIGAGKTTLAQQLAPLLNAHVFYEPVDSNVYLQDFYRDMKTYAFPMQIHLLNHRFRQHQQAQWADQPIIMDRDLAQDAIFAHTLHTSGMLGDRLLRTYLDLHAHMSHFTRQPDLYLHLDADPTTCLERCRQRARDAEATVSLDYLQLLHQHYEQWLSTVDAPILRLDWAHYQSPQHVLEQIQHQLPRFFINH